MALYIGLMSGTSADGIDAALADFTPGKKIQMLDTSFTAWTEEDRSTISSLCTPGDNELHRAGLFSCRYAETAAGAVLKLLQKNDLTPGDITAVASHGQTVRHEPQNGFSVQIGNHAMLAAITGIDVVCDFRSADIALGGQGAPLVPAFHQEICAHPDIPRYVVNIGGIANVSVLIPGTTVTGFDTGPGNTIIDALARKYLNQYSDFDGKTAASGKPADFEDNETLVVELAVYGKDVRSDRFNLADIRKITCHETEGVSETASSSVCISPNPTHDAFMLHNLQGKQSVSIYALDGRLVKSAEVSENQLIDISDFPVGLYLVKTESQTLKMIKL